MTLVEPNYTQVPNLLLDNMADLGEAELRCLLAIVRKIIGYHKDRPEPVSYTQLEKLTGMSRQGVITGVDSAMQRGWLKIDGQGKRGVNLYTLDLGDQSTTLTSEGQVQATPELVNHVDQSTRLTGTGQPRRPELVNDVDTQKKSFKEISSNKEDLVDPSTNSADHSPATDAVVDADAQFILPAIQDLGLTPKAQAELLALGPLKALAITFAAQKPNVRSPAALAVHLMQNSGPPELDLAQAKQALATRCLDREAADRLVRQEELEALNQRTLEVIALKTGQEELPGEGPPSLSPTAPPASLDTILDGGRLTMRDIWQAARRTLELQLNRENYNLWVRDLKALSYADGILTVQARCSTVRDELARHDWLAPAVTRLAGKPIQVRVVLAGEEVRR